MQNWSKGSSYLSVGLIAAGFLVIALAWNGSASQACVDCQFPYLISGGIGGGALVATGLFLANINARRQDTQALLAKLDEVADAVGGAGAAGGPTAVPEGSDLVVAGRTTFHSADCRLIEGRTDLQVMAPQVAKDRGLAPCRICDVGSKTA